LEERGEITTSLSAITQEPLFFYSANAEAEADKLQQFLNEFDGIALRVDSKPGKKTSEATKNLFGFYLKDDPRND